MSEIIASTAIKEYFSNIEQKVHKYLRAAEKAKKIAIDASTEVETRPATDLAERTETIIGPKGVAKRYRELIKKYSGDRLQTVFQIFREILEQKWVSIPNDEKRIEQAIKTCLMLNTEGVVVAPIDGVPYVKISKNFDGTKYVDIYYAGPIRAAGGTSTVLPLILGDYARQLLCLDRYKPTDDEVERYVEETQLYEHLFRRQYRIKPEEVRKIIRGCPVCINGEPTEEKEVAVHRDLERIPSNRIRGAVCIVICDGVALKARKILTLTKMLNLDWSWLEDIIKVEKHGEKTGIEPDYKYLEGLAAGRPIFCYPSRPGGFRLRYGRSRGGGIMGKSIHPATMYLLDSFPAIGTQLKIERPGKAAGVQACDTIEGPIVRLKDKSVLQLKSVKDFEKHGEDIEKILFLGDLLISYGDFKHSAHPLLPAGYCSEWWKQEVKASENNELLKEVSKGVINAEKAVELSERFNIPLHPDFTAYYSLLSKEETIELIKKVQKAEIIRENRHIVKALIEKGENGEIKRLLEKIGLEHSLEGEKIAIQGEKTFAFLKVFGAFDKVDFEALEKKEDALSILRKASGIKVRDKAGTFIGARMGRPESSSERKMKGNPHVLFPIGNAGGAIRSINKAAEKEQIEVEIALMKCKKCGKIQHGNFCTECGQKTENIKQCIKCGKETLQEKCTYCGAQSKGYSKRKIPIKEELKKAAEKLNIKVPKIVKGVRGMISANKIPEPLEKGILRAKHDLHIFRDGTIRYELINNSLTHFKPKEINVSVEKLKELGYKKDKDGNLLENEEQIVELLPQDIIIYEGAGEFFVRVAQFVDEELEKVYGQKPIYNVQNKEELIGELVLGLAPHTSAAIVGRIIGYTQARGCFAHPYFHQAKRRNCVHPETKIIVYDNQKNITEEKQIKELVENAIKEAKMPNTGLITSVIENKKPLFVYALNPKTFTLEKKQIKQFMKNPPPEYWVEIHTSKGKKFTMTPDHRFAFLNEKNEICLKEAKDIKKNDRILLKATKKETAELGECIIDRVEQIKKIKENVASYCIEIEGKNTLEKIVLWGHNILQPRCDGEQDSLTLMMDAFLNFSQEYLPEHRGGRMDAPLVFTSIINPSEIDDEVHKMETCKEYPLELYEQSLKFSLPDIEGIESVANKLGTAEQYSGFNYTHETSDFAAGPKYSTYVQLKSMEEKISRQAELQAKIAAIDTKDSIERVLVSHFLPDCIGNVRSFSKQKFRCTNCNTKYRRIPLNGQCSACKNGNLVLTIAEGSVIKYVDIAKDIIKKYELSDYLKQRMDLVEQEIKSVFRSEKTQQKSLSEFM